VAEVEGNAERLLSSGISAAVVTFGVMEGAKLWLASTGCRLRLLADPDRSLYKAFGLRRSAAKVYSIESMQYYGEKKLTASSVPEPFANIKDDFLQMGGDFTLNCRPASISFYFRSKTPADRPSLQQIFDQRPNQ
jgi:hypothetical protein